MFSAIRLFGVLQLTAVPSWQHIVQKALVRPFMLFAREPIYVILLLHGLCLQAVMP